MSEKIAFHIKIIWLFLLIIGLWGCVPDAVKPFPQITPNLYPKAPGQCSIPGSTGQAIASRNMPVTFDELYDAAYKVAFRRGLEVEYKDARKGRLIGKGFWELPNREQLQIVYAVYIEQVDQRPTSKLTIVVDHLGFTQFGVRITWLQRVLSDYIIDVQKLLSTAQ